MYWQDRSHLLLHLSLVQTSKCHLTGFPLDWWPAVSLHWPVLPHQALPSTSCKFYHTGQCHWPSSVWLMVASSQWLAAQLANYWPALLSHHIPLFSATQWAKFSLSTTGLCEPLMNCKTVYMLHHQWREAPGSCSYVSGGPASLIIVYLASYGTTPLYYALFGIVILVRALWYCNSLVL